MTFPTRLVHFGILACLLLLGGCTTLPQAGPVGKRVFQDGRHGDFIVREIDSEQALPSPPEVPAFKALPPSPWAQTAVLLPGDVLSVVYYEVGARLFSTSPTSNGAFDANAKPTTIGALPIDQDGVIRLPYTGEIRAAGLTPRQLSQEIEARLRGKSENPQVIVQLDAAIGSSVMISGEITRTGRVPLTAARETLLDAISLAGGPRGAPENLLVNVDRHGFLSEGPLSQLTHQNFGGTPLEAGDRVVLLRQPWTYSVLGSANRINRYDLPLRRLSLVEALAQAGGPNEYVANPAAVFVFRYTADAPADKTALAEGQTPPQEVATVYHVNMLKPASYLLAQRFWLKDKDVIYVAGAEANQPSKLFQIIGQIFSPLAVARQATN